MNLKTQDPANADDMKLTSQMKITQILKMKG